MKRCISCDHIFAGEKWECPECGFTPAENRGFLCFQDMGQSRDPGFEARFFEALFHLESRHFWFRARNKLISWALKRFFPQTKTFLEIGGGTGVVLRHLSLYFPGIRFTGSDMFTEGLSFAEKRVEKADFIQMDALANPFWEEFDCIGMFDVLEHIQEDEKALVRVYEALGHKGGLILTVPAHPFLWSAADEYAHHKRRYTQKELLHKIKQAGFEILFQSAFVSLLFPLLVANRIKDRQINENYDPLAELSIGDGLNRICMAVMDTELRMIQTGIRFPAGGSLLAVAEKKE